VGVGTSLFYDPLVCKKINAGIADYLAQNDMASVAGLVGTLDAPKKTVQACAC
jgi:dihydroorotate dehydrogenase (NAD+) catalytic subunit